MLRQFYPIPDPPGAATTDPVPSPTLPSWADIFNVQVKSVVLALFSPHGWMIIAAALGAFLAWASGHLVGATALQIEGGLAVLLAVIEAVLTATGNSAHARLMRLRQ